METELDSLIADLKIKIINDHPELRLMHRISSFCRSCGQDLAGRVEAHVGHFDEFVDNGDEVSAVSEMERLLGLLEGYVSTKSENVENNDLFTYFKLNAADKEKVVELCTGMRKIVLASNDFDHPHKIRLTNRIAAIEAEVHKPKGLFDVILGGVSDVGETLNKFGRDIKPLTDRMKEVRQITQRSTPQYDQIPAPDDIKWITDQSEETPDE